MQQGLRLLQIPYQEPLRQTTVGRSGLRRGTPPAARCWPLADHRRCLQLCQAFSASRSLIGRRLRLLRNKARRCSLPADPPNSSPTIVQCSAPFLRATCCAVLCKLTTSTANSVCFTRADHTAHLLDRTAYVQKTANLHFPACPPSRAPGGPPCLRSWLSPWRDAVER